MKKIILIILTLICAFVAQAQNSNNVDIYPQNDTICYSGTLSVSFAGQSFAPVSYLWSNGHTTPSIEITSSGTYTVTVTGYRGRSNSQTTYTKTKNVVVLEKPTINPLTELWVCKFDTVKLQAGNGYSQYVWNNGQSGANFERAMDYVGTAPTLDTASVWFTASIGTLCSVNSDTVVIRGIRRPNGVGTFYEGRMNLTTSDSVPAGLVLTYLYAPQYEMEFAKVSDPTYVVTYVTPNTTRNAPLDILEAGFDYYVRTRPIINGVTYCWGSNSHIGVLPLCPQGSKESNSGMSSFVLCDLAGRVLCKKYGHEFDNSWLDEFPNQTIIVMEKEETYGNYGQMQAKATRVFSPGR